MMKSALPLIFLNIFVISVQSFLNDVNLKEVLRMADDYVEDLNEDESNFKFNLIYPGTKWCGAGDIAENYDDLGPDREPDLCCRDHDNCPDFILSRETKYGLTNNALITRFSCDCDEKFRQCLRGVYENSNSISAKNLGYIYFNGLNTECFRNDYPVVRCIRRGGWLGEKCLEYEYDTSSPKEYQFFDVRNF